MGKFKKDAVGAELAGSVRETDQTQEDHYGEHREAGYENLRSLRSFLAAPTT
jgi:hypothetical protein